MICVAIVEDDTDIRNNLQECLNMEPNFSCTIATESVENFFAVLSPQSLPDIILMDVGLPGMSGIDGIKLIKHKYPDIEVLMLTIYDDSPHIFEALRAGASGYLLKTTSFPELRSFIELVHQGGAPMSPQIARKVVQYFQPQKKKQKKSPLSSREKEVVIALVDGLSYKMIADRMHISVGTIYSHIRNIYKKLQVHSKVEVITKSLRGEI